jgi:hypothetical protein
MAGQTAPPPYTPGQATEAVVAPGGVNVYASFFPREPDVAHASAAHVGPSTSMAAVGVEERRMSATQERRAERLGRRRRAKAVVRSQGQVQTQPPGVGSGPMMPPEEPEEEKEAEDTAYGKLMADLTTEPMPVSSHRVHVPPEPMDACSTHVPLGRVYTVAQVTEEPQAVDPDLDFEFPLIGMAEGLEDLDRSMVM